MPDMFALNPTGYAGIFSCFVTMMLSTTRALALAKPLYDIKVHFVRRAFIIFTTFLFLLLVIKDIVAYYQFLMDILMILMVELLRQPLQEQNF